MKMQWVASTGMIILAVMAFAMLVSAQSVPQDSARDWPAGIPNPWKHVETGPDASHYADGLIEWIHYRGAGEKPGMDPLATSYFAHLRLGENATTLIPGTPPEPQQWTHVIPASPYLPPENH